MSASSYKQEGMPPDALDFYRAHSPITEPGGFAPLFRDLPRDVHALCEILHGICIHLFHAKKYGFLVPATRTAEIRLVDVPALLACLFEHNAAPLTVPRPPEERLVASCRHYSVLLCSILRTQGVPARVRCGFETYFHRDKFGDHWVAEYWNDAQQRWVLVDPQIDDLHRAAFRIGFDVTDLGPDRLALAGDMWGRCRRGEVDPNLCGLLGAWGMDYVRANVVRDMACLNKIERFPWDGAPLIDKADDNVTDQDLMLLDTMAEKTWPDVRIEEVLALYTVHPELRIVPLALAEPPIDVGA